MLESACAPVVREIRVIPHSSSLSRGSGDVAAAHLVERRDGAQRRHLHKAKVPNIRLPKMGPSGPQVVAAGGCPSERRQAAVAWATDDAARRHPDARREGA